MKNCLVFLALFSSFATFAQEKQSISDSLFGEYYKIGLFVGTSTLFVENESNAIDFAYRNTQTFELGLEYNFYQWRNLNFKTAFIYRNHKMISFKRFKGEDTTLSYDFSGTTKWGPYEQYKFSVLAEYLIPLSQKLSVNVNIGPEITFFPNSESSGSHFAILSDGTEVGNTHEGESPNPISAGMNIGIGLNFKMPHFLLRPVLSFHFQTNNLFTDVVTTQNLQVSENTVSEHSVTGNYLMFGMSILPSKSLFKGKG